MAEIGKLVDLNQRELLSLKESANNEEIEMYVGFNISNEEYGIDIMIIKEIIRKIEITVVPNAPKFVEGVINLRGEVIPVIDLRKKFDMKDTGRKKDARTIVVEINDKSTGIIVDKVTEVVKIKKKNIDPPPQMANAIRKEYIKNVGRIDKRLIMLLDIEKIIKKN